MIKLIASLALFVLFDSSCSRPATRSGPAGYELTKPEVLSMPGVLDEISGIAFDKGDPNIIYAEQDEEGKIFAFTPGDKNITHRKFGKKGDYEDIAIANGITYILRSDGTLFSFPLQSAEEEISGVTESANLLPKGEYEGMYADETAGLLYVLCKSCDDDNANKTITGHILQIAVNKGIEYKSSFQVNTKEIAAKLGDKKLAFRPSALAKNSVSHQWFILSSVNKLLVIADEQWTIREVYPLDPALFNQPEGIAFDKNNALYISNERAVTGNATILKYPFTTNKK